MCLCLGCRSQPFLAVQSEGGRQLLPPRLLGKGVIELVDTRHRLPCNLTAPKLNLNPLSDEIRCFHSA
jgi:hypothetical protein